MKVNLKKLWLIPVLFAILPLAACNLSVNAAGTPTTVAPVQAQATAELAFTPGPSPTPIIQSPTPAPYFYMQIEGKLEYKKDAASLNVSLSFYPAALPEGVTNTEKISYSVEVDDTVVCSGEIYQGPINCGTTIAENRIVTVKVDGQFVYQELLTDSASQDITYEVHR